MNRFMKSDSEPKLAAPGAGLPAIELWVARLFFGRRLRKGTRERFTAEFQAERQKIAAELRPLTVEQASRRVLIPRLRGLEDSSRYWSVWMTLEHLRIVHEGVVGVIKSLAAGVVPPGAASTARVKPRVDVTETVVTAYENSCSAVLDTVASVKDLKTKERFPHPWFGPLNAFGWHALAANHLAIHRNQIEQIIRRL